MKDLIFRFLKFVKRSFADHPNDVGESYFIHLIWATIYSIHFFCGSIACLIHAIFPFLFKDTGSSIARWIVDSVDSRGDML